MLRKRIRDPIILGMCAGLLGNTVKIAGNQVDRHALKKSDTTFMEIASGLFMTKKEQKKPAGKTVGVLADYSLGAALGVPLVYLLKYTGEKNAAIKGLLFGHLAWVTMYGTLGRAFGPKKGVFPLNADTNLAALFNHSWYGLATALFIKHFGDFSNTPEEQLP